MLFNELDKLKRNAIMLTILLIFVGFILLILPEEYIPYVGGVLGFALLVLSVFIIFSFISSKKALIHYILLTFGLLTGLLGAIFLIFDGLFITALAWIVAVVPILFGFYSIAKALLFGRRSGRKGWWIMIILASLLIVFGSFMFINPWEGNTLAIVRVIGGTLVYSAFISGITLIWTWPIKKEENDR